MTATLHLVENDYNSVTKKEDWPQTLSDLFASECGITLNPSQFRTIVYFLEKGNDPFLIAHIISYTASAFRPSFRYFETVLRNLNDDQIFVFDAYLDKGETCRKNYMQKKSLHYI